MIMINKAINGIMLTFCVVMLSACASRQGSPADASNAMAYGSGAKTYALSKEDNLAGTDVGPHNGILGIRSFYFAFDSNVVVKKDYLAIQAHGQYLLDHHNARVVIEGNTDERGSREYNIGLGERRADAVLSILRMQGVPKVQIRTLSYGAEKPVALGHNEKAYHLNRRDDVVYEAN